MAPQSREMFVCESCGYIADKKRILADIAKGVFLELRHYTCNKCDTKVKSELVTEEDVLESCGSSRKVSVSEYDHSENRGEEGIQMKYSEMPKSGIEQNLTQWVKFQYNGSEEEPHSGLKTMTARATTLYCDLCGYVAESGRGLLDHVNGVHLKLKPYKCDRCNYTTANSSNLSNHKKTPHMNCGQCSFTTYNSVLLKMHAKEHMIKDEEGTKNLAEYKNPVPSIGRESLVKEDVEPGKTGKCDKEINDAIVQKSESECKEVTNIRKLKCNECDYECNTNRGLKRHVNSVHPKVRKVAKVKCPDCGVVCSGMRCLSRHALDVHQKVLNVNKNPREAQGMRKTKLAKDKLCHLCAYSTAYEFNLKNHLNAMHLREKVYKCHICDYTSSYARWQFNSIKFDGALFWPFLGPIFWNCLLKSLTVHMFLTKLISGIFSGFFLGLFS